MFDHSVLLSLLIWMPTVGALSLLPLRSGEQQHSDDHHGGHGHQSHGQQVRGQQGRGQQGGGGLLRNVALIWSVMTLLLAILTFLRWDGSTGELELVEHYSWIPSLGASYSLGIDGISMYLVLLTAGLMPLVIFTSRAITRQLKGYLASMLILETAMLGTLLATDLLLFYLFWELMLAPMYFIIGIWGGARRVYATVKFVLYTVAGSVLMLVAILFCVWRAYAISGELSFGLSHLLTYTTLSVGEELWLFGFFALAFGIKVPIFPFHTWLPDAHVEAPTGGSVVLAGVLLKMGLYGFIRFAYPLFPRAAEIATPLICGLAVIGIIYGALVAWVQVDMKKLVAYSSVSHLGYCVLGFFAFNSLAVSGSILQMVNHGISTGALFLLVGVLYDRTHSREIADYAGLAGKLPLYAFLFVVFTLSSIAVPLTNGFVGEFMILAGSYQGQGVVPALAVIALVGVILSAVYMLTLALKILFGAFQSKYEDLLSDVSGRELCSFIPLLFFVFYLGVHPQPLLSGIQPSIDRYLREVTARAQNLPRERAPVILDQTTGTEQITPRTVEATGVVAQVENGVADHG